MGFVLFVEVLLFFSGPSVFGFGIYTTIEQSVLKKLAENHSQV